MPPHKPALKEAVLEAKHYDVVAYSLMPDDEPPIMGWQCFAFTLDEAAMIGGAQIVARNKWNMSPAANRILQRCYANLLTVEEHLEDAIA